MTDADQQRQQEAARQTRKDLTRLQGRPPDSHSWQALRVIGGVGWPIALLSLLGAALGAWLDGPSWLKAALIGGGAALGGFVALSGIGRHGR